MLRRAQWTGHTEFQTMVSIGREVRQQAGPCLKASRGFGRSQHLLAQVRCAVINGELSDRLRQWARPESTLHPVLLEAPIA